jgi:hypothetical protein
MRTGLAKAGVPLSFSSALWCVTPLLWDIALQMRVVMYLFFALVHRLELASILSSSMGMASIIHLPTTPPMPCQQRREKAQSGIPLADNGGAKSQVGIEHMVECMRTSLCTSFVVKGRILIPPLSINSSGSAQT